MRDSSLSPSSRLGGAVISDRIVSALLEELRTGRYAQTDRLPAEVDLAAELGVSRTVIRDALSEMERAGYIERVRGIGTVVNRSVLNLRSRLDQKLEYYPLIRSFGSYPHADGIQIYPVRAGEELARDLAIEPGDDVIAQTLSAALVLIVLLRAKNCCRLSLKKLRIHRSMLAKILKVGIPAALQMAVTAFSNVFVQSYINSFGEDCMGGWTAYVKIDQFLFLPMQSISLAVTTFVGQNLGINQVARAKKGIRAGMLMAVACTALLMVPVLIFAPQLVEFFNKKREIVDYGSMLLRLISPFYVFCCINQIFAGALRGAGNSRTPMFIMIGSFVVFRQIYLFIMANYISNTIKPIALSYPAGWLLCSLITALYFKFAKWEKHRVVDIE